MSVSAGAKVQRRTSGLSDKVRKRIEITILSLPALIMFLGFVILPVFMAGYYGFFK
ncbi:ABC transporter permease [Bifidobacterium longum subsp. longum]|nr:ABC transporter permease [Bifidobacterium longum subsp. longum]